MGVPLDAANGTIRHYGTCYSFSQRGYARRHATKPLAGGPWGWTATGSTFSLWVPEKTAAPGRAVRSKPGTAVTEEGSDATTPVVTPFGG